MEFCEVCDNLLFLQRIDRKLRHYCKVCDISQPFTRKENCIYETDHTDNYLSYKNLHNPYLYLDSTLPRINTLQCPNTKCYTNQEKQFFDNMIHITNIPYEIFEQVNNEIKKWFLKMNYLDTDYKIEPSITKSELIITIYKNEKINELIKLLVKIDIIQKHKITITSYKKPKNEIVFIKYDNINMKYLYFCTNCKISWKNE